TIVSLAWFATTEEVWLATCMIFVFGYAITICAVASQTLVQNSIDDDMRGRVLSLWVAFTRGAPALGVLIIGWAAHHVGLMIPNVVAALLCLAVCLPLWRARADMRRYFEVWGAAGRLDLPHGRATGFAPQCPLPAGGSWCYPVGDTGLGETLP